jgi:PAS domain S-box-containing protein
MKLQYKLIGILLIAFLVPVVVIGVGGYLSIRQMGTRASDESARSLMQAQRLHLQDATRAGALEIEQLCEEHQNDVEHLRSRFERTHKELGNYRLDRIADRYPDKDKKGLPGYGYVHPEHGSYADFDARGPGGPWVPRRVVRQLAGDATLRARVVEGLHAVMLADADLVELGRRHKGTLDLAWIVLETGVTNVYPEYDYNEILARDPGISEMDENGQDYVALASPKNNPQRSTRWLVPYLDRFKGVWMTSCVAPVYDGDRFVGTVGMDILLNVITGQILKMKHGQAGYAMLVGPGGRLIALPEAGIREVAWAPKHQRALRDTLQPAANQTWTEEMTKAATLSLLQSPNAALRELVAEMDRGTTGSREIGLGLEPKHVSWAPIRNAGWSLAVVIPTQELVAPSETVRSVVNQGVERTVRDYVALGLFVAGLSILVGILLHYLAIRPLARFTRQVEAVGWDNLDFPLPVRRRRDEIGQLYRKFAEMIRMFRGARDEVTSQGEKLEAANRRLTETNTELTREIADRSRAETALAREKELLAITLGSIGDGVITTDARGRIVLINAMAAELTGWKPDEAQGQALGDVCRFGAFGAPAMEADPVSRVLESGAPFGTAEPTPMVSRKGTERSVTHSAEPIRDEQGKVRGVVLVIRDATEKARLEEALMTAQKLESVQLLAAGIAHDFNNLLTSILGNVSLSRSYARRGKPFDDRLGDAETAALRARSLTAQLLTFSTGGAPVRKVLDIRNTMREAARFALQGSKVRCEFAFADDLWSVDADEGQAVQVVQNLVINAAQAMPQGGGIRIDAHNQDVPEGADMPLRAGRYVRVEVHDEGEGIAREAMPKIFDPFFTTKPKGSGLGLAVCYSIVQRHHGHIEADSEPGRGTVVRFYLPAAAPSAQDTPAASGGVRTGTGRVLVMDDDEMIRSMAISMLRELGYEATVANDGAAAVEEYRRAAAEGRPFHAVILDLTVPGGVGGLDAIRQIKEIDPAVHAIVSSGYSTDDVMGDVAKHGFCASLPKPFDLEALGTALGDALRISPDRPSRSR